MQDDRFRRVKALPRGVEVGGEIDEEVAFHLREKADRLMREGMTEEEAWREALRRFGDVEEVKTRMTRQQRARAARRSWDWLKQDVWVALRSMRRRKGFAAMTVASLALGIGAVTAVFTLVDGVLLSPLPFDEPEKLVSIGHAGSTGPLEMSQTVYALYRDEASALEDVALFERGSVNLVVDGEPRRVRALHVTPSFFGVLRADAELGRTFAPGEGTVRRLGRPVREEGTPVAVLSEGLWRGAFGADPSVLGRTVEVDGVSREIVGVMPADFGYPDRRSQIWLPVFVDPAVALAYNFSSRGIGRLAPSVSVDAATQELTALMSRVRDMPGAAMSQERWEGFGLRPVLVPLREAVVGDVGSTLWILLGSVGFLLLVASANVVNLILVQADARRREYALRAMLGASRLRVLSSFLGEAGVLAVAGGVAGVAVAALAVRGALAFVPTDLPRVDEIGIDLRVLTVSAGVTVVCALAFCLVPYVGARRGLESGLAGGGSRGSTAGSARQRSRVGLVVVQTALALVLLVGSGLMLRSFDEMRQIDPGFDPGRTLTARLSVSESEIPGSREADAFFRDLADRLTGFPGVEAVGFSLSLPLDGGPTPNFDFRIEDYPRGPDESPIMASHDFTRSDYFAAVGTRILEGRALREGDGADGTRSVVVSRALAEQWWPGQSAVGHRVAFGDPRWGWYTIVGVAEDVRFESLTQPQGPMVYWPETYGSPDSPQVQRTLAVVVRTESDPLGFASALRDAVAEVHAGIAVSDVDTMEDIHRAASARTSFTMALLGVAAGTALFLGLVGIYGVVSYAASRRTREIGIRIAVGATRSQVRRMVAGTGLTMAVAGIALGLLASIALSSFLESVLFGVSALDPVTYAVAGLVILGVALAASWIPAARASSIEPTRALGAE